MDYLKGYSRGMEFSIPVVIGEAWGLTKKHFGFLWGGMAWCMVFPALSSGILFLELLGPREQAFEKGRPMLMPPVFGWFLIWLFVMLVNVAFLGGFLRGLLRAVRGHKPKWSDLRGAWDVFGKLMALIRSLTIPGGADSDLALKRRWALARECRRELIGLFLAVIGLNLLGELCLFVGLIATIPLSVMMLLVVYEKLRLRADGAEPFAIPPAP